MKNLTHGMLDALYEVYVATGGVAGVPPASSTPRLAPRYTEALIRRGYLIRVEEGPRYLRLTERGRGYILGFLEAGVLGSMILRSVTIRFDEIHQRSPKKED